MSTTWFLQTINAFLFCMSAVVVLVFVDILIRSWELRREPFYSAALGILVIHAGNMIRQGWLWAWRYFGGTGDDWMKWPQVSVFIFSLVVISFGTACLLRVFSYDRYGHWPWLFAIFASGVMAVLLSIDSAQLDYLQSHAQPFIDWVRPYIGRLSSPLL